MNYGEAGLQVREVAHLLQLLQKDMESRPGAYTYADKGLLHRLTIYTDSLPIIADALLEHAQAHRSTNRDLASFGGTGGDEHATR